MQTVRRTLESVFGDAQDFEFTVEDGALWLLQTRAAKRTPWAALRIACDLVDDGVIDPATALARLQAYDIETLSRSRLASDQEPQPAAQAVPASAGVACASSAPTAVPGPSHPATTTFAHLLRLRPCRAGPVIGTGAAPQTAPDAV